jgi:potassium-transporting ATPase KdpC subunit
MFPSEMRKSLRMILVLTVILGGIYPLLVTVVSRVIMPDKAEGSIIYKNGAAVGSRLIGQPFQSPGYFWSRPSATGPYPYNGGSSSGSNLGPTNPVLVKGVKGNVEALKSADPGNKAPVPVDLATASGSGLDPDISPAAAKYQLARVARARNMSEAQVAELVERFTSGRTFRFIGEKRVNVLELNLALDAFALASGGEK